MSGRCLHFFRDFYPKLGRHDIQKKLGIHPSNQKGIKICVDGLLRNHKLDVLRKVVYFFFFFFSEEKIENFIEKENIFLIGLLKSLIVGTR